MLKNITLQTILQWGSYWIAFFSVLNNILPPREIFKDFPGFLKFYNVVLNLVAFWGAINWRQKTVAIYGRMGVSLDPPLTAQRRGFLRGVDATKNAVKETVKEAVETAAKEVKADDKVDP